MYWLNLCKSWKRKYNIFQHYVSPADAEKALKFLDGTNFQGCNLRIQVISVVKVASFSGCLFASWACSLARCHIARFDQSLAWGIKMSATDVGKKGTGED